MRVDFDEAIKFIYAHDNYHILTHQSPDGDTLGSAFSLCAVLRKLGKKANVLCSDEFPHRYDNMYEGYRPMKFMPEAIVAVDVADSKLLGRSLAHYSEYVNLCIDHHISNTEYAERTLLNANASAACEIMFELYEKMGVELDTYIASCLYTGIATDTGCFKYENTTPRCHQIAAELMSRYNVPYAIINRKMFDVKSKDRMRIEQYVMSNMEFYFDDRCSMITITEELTKDFGIELAEFEGLASLTVQLENVEIGVTIKQKSNNIFKISMRSATTADVSEICRKLGGGGHVKAAGAQLTGTPEEVKRRILTVVGEALGYDLWLV